MTAELDTTGKITIDGSGTDTDEGELNLTTFDGQTVSSGDAVVALTYYGDANLDRQVNSTDYDMIGSVQSYTGDGDAGWTDGDFQYNGLIGTIDQNLWQFGSLLAPCLSATTPPTQRLKTTLQSGGNGDSVNVQIPSPGSATGLTINSVITTFPNFPGTPSTSSGPAIGTTPVVAAGNNLQVTSVNGTSVTTVQVSIGPKVVAGTYYLICTLQPGGGTVVIEVDVK